MRVCIRETNPVWDIPEQVMNDEQVGNDCKMRQERLAEVRYW